ncbi:hypothetical protein GF406_11375 [candidate division KSB1 bacterium]|nr:hypothetical protein [candidate division KSB1 bacterium]
MKWLLMSSFHMFIITSLTFSQSINLKDFFSLVRQNHPSFKALDLPPRIQQINSEQIATRQDWRIESRPALVYSRPIPTSPFSPTRVTSASVDASMNRTFWSTGGRFSVGWASDLTDQNLPPISFPTAGGRFQIPTGFNRLYTHTFSLNYTQPLLQNYGGELDRLPYEISEMQLSITELQTFEQQEKILLSFGISFLEWILAEEKVKIAQDRLDLSTEAYRLITEKHESFLVDQVDVLRSEDAVILAEQTLMLFQSQAESKRAELAIMLEKPDLETMNPVYALYETREISSPDDVKENISDLRPIIIQERSIEQLEKQKQGFVEAKKSRLDLNVGFRLLGGDDAIGQSLEMTYPDFSAVLVYSQTLGKRSAELDIQKATVQLRQADYEQKQAKLEILSRIRNLWVQIENMKEIMELSRTQIQTAEKKTEQELELYNKGKSQLNFVIQSRDNEENARLRYAENAVRYHQMIMQYHELTDRLTDVQGE